MSNGNDIHIFIPSYHRADNIKTAHYFVRKGWRRDHIHVVIDDEGGDVEEYRAVCERMGVRLHVFCLADQRDRYDFVHRQSPSRRAAGMSRNSFYDIAKAEGIDFYVVIDDDTQCYQRRNMAHYAKTTVEGDEIRAVFNAIKEMMQRRHIGCFGLSQTGDMMKKWETRLVRKKIMNTTFYDLRYVYRGEKGVQDDDTSQFVNMMNEGYWAVSLASGLVLSQMPSATQKGGLTDLYNENKLLNKAMITPIQFPSAIRGEKQKKNGNRLHHKCNYRYLMPYLMRGKRDNLAWDAYPEDGVFTCEPLNRCKQRIWEDNATTKADS